MNKNKYTLIELIVTLSIISILMTLFFQVVEVGKKKVKSVQCVENVKNITANVFAYAGDNMGILPSSLNYAASETKDNSAKARNYDAIEFGWTYKTIDYFSNVDSFECPFQQWHVGQDDFDSDYWAGKDLDEQTINGRRSLLSYNLNAAWGGWSTSGQRTDRHYAPFYYSTFNRPAYRLSVIDPETILALDYNNHSAGCSKVGKYSSCYSNRFKEACDVTRWIGTGNHAGESASLSRFDGSAKMYQLDELWTDKFNVYGDASETTFDRYGWKNLNTRTNSSFVRGYWSAGAGD